MKFCWWKKLREYAVSLLEQMVRIYSPSGKEGEIASFLYSEMKDLGFEVELDEVGNVIGRFEGESPRVLLCGHMDTIPGEIDVRRDGEVIFGRGAVDAKAPLAAMIVATSELMKEGYAGGLMLVGAVDEEGKGLGVKHLVKERLDVDYAIFGEPTNVDSITVGYKGSVLIKITCETKTGHSSAPWLFVNSIEKAFEIWGLIKEVKMPQEMHDSYFNSISSSLLRIKGGEEGSVIPSFCQIYVNFRIPPAISSSELLNEVHEILREFKCKNPDVKVNIEILDKTESYLSDSKSILVRALSQSIWKTKKTLVRLVRKTGTGDMNVFGAVTGKPVVTYGPGDPHLDHTPEERVNIKDYLESIDVIKGALRRLAELHHLNKAGD
jgi:LysW-gamma-L-lysine carboxypeptidase